MARFVHRSVGTAGLLVCLSLSAEALSQNQSEAASDATQSSDDSAPDAAQPDAQPKAPAESVSEEDEGKKPVAAPTEAGASPAASEPAANAAPAPAAAAPVAPAPAATPKPQPQAAPAAGATASFGAAGSTSATNPTADQASAAGHPKPQKEDEKLAWRGTTFSWDHTVTTQTVGVGADYQSRNPLYTWTFLLRPRYYVYEADNFETSIRADIGLATELTNSDDTTKEHEIDTSGATSADWQFYAVHSIKFTGAGPASESSDRPTTSGFKTSADVVLPEVILPTSKASRNNGTIMQLGVGFFPRQTVPLLGEDSAFLRSMLLIGRARYRYLFTDSTVPTNEDIAQYTYSVGDNGISIPNSQLAGSAFARHQARLGFAAAFDLMKAVTLASVFEWRPSWKYRVGETECVDILTGCAEPDPIEDPQTFGVTSMFALDMEIAPMEQGSISLTYANIGGQIGPNGERRNMFWSPSAVFAGTLTLYLDSLYTTARAL